MLLAYRFYWAKDAELAAVLACITTAAARALVAKAGRVVAREGAMAG